MNREILFRAKRVDDGEWVEGLLIIMWGQYHMINPNDENTAYPIDTETLCQYTGLTDKNGNKIWENDICDRKEQFPEIVKYYQGDWILDYSYLVKKDYGYCFCNLGFYVCERRCVEVIGNVFDNPELLEVQNERN